MKISFTREEVEEIILAHVARTFGAKLNTVDLRSLYGSEFACVTYEEPEPPAATEPVREAA